MSYHTSGKASLNRFCVKFHAWLLAAKARLSWEPLESPPVVISSDNMNDSNPVSLNKGKVLAQWER